VTKTVRILLVGLGNLGRRFCDLLAEKGDHIEEYHSLRLSLVGAADSRGWAYNPNGLDPTRVSAIKQNGGSIASLPRLGKRGQATKLIAQAEADLLCEASPVNLWRKAEPGIAHIRAALERGMHVVTPNKGPLALAYQELHDLAARCGAQLRFDGTVAGGLPAVNLGQRDLRGAAIHRIEAVPNLVTGYIIELMSDGLDWEEALDQAHAEGVLEADPAFDMEGWDAAAKLVILVNATMQVPAQLDEVECTGIMGLSGEDVREARQGGKIYKLLASADRNADGSINMRVAPTPLPADHFLARLGRKQMGVVYQTDIYGTLMAAIDEPTPLPSAATMLRDILDIYLT
jgi:homoserine dehydrogenase